jgi:hypothetical protein
MTVTLCLLSYYWLAWVTLVQAHLVVVEESKQGFLSNRRFQLVANLRSQCFNLVRQGSHDFGHPLHKIDSCQTSKNILPLY